MEPKHSLEHISPFKMGLFMLAWKTSSPHPTCLEAQKMTGLCSHIFSKVSLSPGGRCFQKHVINYLVFTWPQEDLSPLPIFLMNKIKLCFFFVFFFSSNEGVWSSEGCVRSGGNMTYSVCLCNHLTNFAILMQVVPLEVWKLGFPFNLPLLILPIAPMELSNLCFSDCIRITHCSPQYIRP